MKKRLAIVGLAIALAAVICLLAIPSEPQYQGRRLGQWVRGLSGFWSFPADYYRTNEFALWTRSSPLDEEGLTPEKRAAELEKKQAIAALDALGPAAVPWLSSQWQAPASKKTKVLAFIAQHSPNFVGLKMKKWGWFDRQDAVISSALCVLGPQAHSLLPLMLQKVADADPQVRGAALAIASAMFVEPEDLPLIRALTNHPATRLAGITLLAEKAPHSIPPEELGAWLLDSNAEFKRAACVAVRKLGPRASGVLPQLVTLAHTKDQRQQRMALDCLEEIGAPAAEALGELFPQYMDYNDCGLYLLMSLMEPRGDMAKARALLQTYVQADPNKVPQIVLLLIDRSEKVVLKSAVFLRELTAISPVALPALLKLLDHKNKYMRAKASLALGLMRSDSPAVVPALIKCLDDTETIVRLNAADALRAYGSHAASAADKLRARLATTNQVERLCYSNALRVVARNE